MSPPLPIPTPDACTPPTTDACAPSTPADGDSAVLAPVLLTGDIRRQVRRLHAGVLVFFIVDGLLMGGFGALGTIPWWVGPAFAIGGCTLSGLVIHRFWRRGGRLAELDASSLQQSVVAGLVMLAALACAPQIGGLVLMSMMALVALGAVPLGMKALIAFCLVMSGASVVLLAWAGEPAGIPGADAAERALTGVWFAWLLAKASAHNAFSRQLRRRVDLTNARLAEALRELEQLAATDELTVLPNRRSIIGMLRGALAESTPPETGGQVGVAVLDIDDFKAVNDRHGHDVGDRVLRVFAELASAGLRQGDRLGRYGGEEFLLVLRQLPDAQAAVDATERLRARVAAHDWQRVVPGLAVTGSAGVALVGVRESSGVAIQRADVALYEAKRGGRNRVVLQAPPAELPA